MTFFSHPLPQMPRSLIKKLTLLN